MTHTRPKEKTTVRPIFCEVVIRNDQILRCGKKKMAKSVTRLNEPTVVSTVRRLRQRPSMKAYQNFWGGTQEQMTTMVVLI